MNTAVRISLAASVRSLSPGALTSRLNTKARATTATTRVPQATRRTISMGPPLPSRELGHVTGGKDAAVTLAVWLVRKGPIYKYLVSRAHSRLFSRTTCARATYPNIVKSAALVRSSPPPPYSTHTRRSGRSPPSPPKKSGCPATYNTVSYVCRTNLKRKINQNAITYPGT